MSLWPLKCFSFLTSSQFRVTRIKTRMNLPPFGLKKTLSRERPHYIRVHLTAGAARIFVIPLFCLPHDTEARANRHCEKERVHAVGRESGERERAEYSKPWTTAPCLCKALLWKSRVGTPRPTLRRWTGLTGRRRSPCSCHRSSCKASGECSDGLPAARGSWWPSSRSGRNFGHGPIVRDLDIQIFLKNNWPRKHSSRKILTVSIINKII